MRVPQTMPEVQQITGIHQLFIGVESFSGFDFQSAINFAKANNIDTLLIKIADGTNTYYGGMNNWNNIKKMANQAGIRAIPYIYSYGDTFGMSAFDGEIQIMASHLSNDGIICIDAETEWDGKTYLAEHLVSSIQNIDGYLMITTWANPSQHAWLDIIKVLAPITLAFLPQQYDNYLAQFWAEFGNQGAKWLQPVVDLSGEFGPDDPVAIAQAGYSQSHSAIVVWEYIPATQYTDLLRSVYNTFPEQGATNMQTFTPTSYDFTPNFTLDSNGNFVSKFDGSIIMGGNLVLYCSLSPDGGALPVPGRPLTNELYQSDPNGYHWSVQFFERAMFVYDPQHIKGGIDGEGTSYVGNYRDYIDLDPHFTAPNLTTGITLALINARKALSELTTSIGWSLQYLAVVRSKNLSLAYDQVNFGVPYYATYADINAQNAAGHFPFDVDIHVVMPIVDGPDNGLGVTQWYQLKDGGYISAFDIQSVSSTGE